MTAKKAALKQAEFSAAFQCQNFVTAA